MIGLAKRRGIEAIERRNMPEELSGFEKSFVSGTGSEVTPACEAGPYKFTPGAMSFVLIDDNSVGVRTRQKTARGGNSALGPCRHGRVFPSGAKFVLPYIVLRRETSHAGRAI